MDLSLVGMTDDDLAYYQAGRDQPDRPDDVRHAMKAICEAVVTHDQLEGQARRDSKARDPQITSTLAGLRTKIGDLHGWLKEPAGGPVAPRPFQGKQYAIDGAVGVDRGLGRRQVLGREHKVADWLAARGQVRPDDAELSFDRYLKGLATGDWSGAELEQKAMSEGTLTAGGHLVPTPLAARVIDLARNAMRVMQAGAVTVPMLAATLKVPRLTGEGSPGWTAENAPITDADLAFDAVTFTARKLTRLVKLSTELFEDSDPSAEDVIAASFATQIALEVDRAALRGSGTAPEPRGVLNTSGVTVTAHGANGSTIGSPPAAGVMGWEFLVQAAGAVRNSNFEPNAQLMAPRTDQSLSLLRDTTNQYIAPPRYLDEIPRLPTKQIPTNLTVGTSTDCSEVYTGQWNQLMLGIRATLVIDFLRERFRDNDQYAFLARLRADVQLAQPAAFVVDTGVRG